MPKLYDKKCGFETCWGFAEAIVGGAPCYGCVAGGPEVVARVCELVGVSVPEEQIQGMAHSLGKGYVQVYTGNGKGKTTAALGLAFRAARRD